MGNVLSVIWLISTGRNPLGGEEALKMYLTRFMIFMKIQGRDIFILLMRIFSAQVKKGKNVHVNWQDSLWIKA